jgi:copper(I)-binding protein
VFVKNDITVSTGDINMTAGDVIVSSGAVTVDPNDATGGALTITNTTTQTSGDLVSITGDTDENALRVVAGDVEVTAGDVIVTAGDINMTAGGVTVSTGSVTVSAGDTYTNKLYVTESEGVDHPVTAKTKNAVEGGVTTSESSYYTPGDEEAWKAFDKTTATRWASASGTFTATTGAYAGAVSTTTDQAIRNGEWVQYHDTTPFSITGYKMVESITNAYPTDWYLCGSTDGSTWIELDSQTGENINTEQTYTLASESATYGYYRLIITASGNQSSLTWTRFQSMTFLRDNLIGLKVETARTELGGELKMTSTTNAFIPPVLTTAQRDALTAVEGMVVYNTTTNVLNFYNGSAWGAV